MFNIHWQTLASVWNCKPNKKLRFFSMHFVSYEFFTATIIILMFFALNVTAATNMSTSDLDPRLCIIHACQRGWNSLYLPLVFPTCPFAHLNTPWFWSVSPHSEEENTSRCRNILSVWEIYNFNSILVETTFGWIMSSVSKAAAAKRLVWWRIEICPGAQFFPIPLNGH